MKVFHIESGLGNQMLSYCELLAARSVMSNDEYFIETIIYDIPECNRVICQWNGFELERIFGIKETNVKTLFSDAEWNKVMNEIRESRFWEKNWNYPVYFTNAFNHVGIHLNNIRGDFEEPTFASKYSGKRSFKSIFVDTKVGDTLKRYYYKIEAKKKIQAIDNRHNVFLSEREDVFTGQWLSFKYKSNGIERIDSEIRKTFKFPDLENPKDIETANFIKSHNSVAIHARRGDMLGYNGSCYKYGYFKRAIRLIKNRVENPVFVFFCDPGSVEWCKDNPNIFSLNFKKDTVMFVDWNKGETSYRDMQLMSMCKHAIITNSSFGWWGAYFIEYPNKITISPDTTINTTHHC